ncbi:iron ABC transporter permease [Rhodophyticola sp. CCM32]|uniref:FecCD family ABC transporter permease n=1 Tax=Rhodophyticola sp. CCM32 TaxID=2916397 RepID=UPI00107F3059|nr:iron ABC transporter permease [Rhodophyticola sp. CCM32]QBY01746.1 iron ABC transporter permease [Rhodophyticola sp. CCM32]
MRVAFPAVLVTCFGLAVLGLHLGVRAYAPVQVWTALTAGGDSATDVIIRDLRVPRMALAIIVGAALGLAGLLMQSVTRNPIAEPGLLGVNAGAAFAVVMLITLSPGAGFGSIALCAGLGALLAAALVFGLAFSAGGGLSPIQLLLAGVTVAALLISAMQVLILMNESVLEELLFWLSGSFADRPLTGLWVVLAGLAAGTLIALALSAALDVLRTDDATAQSLGVPVFRLRFGVLAIAALLSGLSVALAGPVAFVGLVAPHLARLAGAETHRHLIPLSLIFGVMLGLSADLMARFILYPTEAPVSAVTALVGVPLLLVLLRRNRIRVS